MSKRTGDRPQSYANLLASISLALAAGIAPATIVTPSSARDEMLRGLGMQVDSWPEGKRARRIMPYIVEGTVEGAAAAAAASPHRESAVWKWVHENYFLRLYESVAQETGVSVDVLSRGEFSGPGASSSSSASMPPVEASATMPHAAAAPSGEGGPRFTGKAGTGTVDEEGQAALSSSRKRVDAVAADANCNCRGRFCSIVRGIRCEKHDRHFRTSCPHCPRVPSSSASVEGDTDPHDSSGEVMLEREGLLSLDDDDVETVALGTKKD